MVKLGAVAGFSAAAAAGLALAFGGHLGDVLPGDTTTSTVIATPDTKAGAELLVLKRAADLVTDLTRKKFVDPITGLLFTNDYAQCFPSTTTNGWWACGLNSWVHPRPRAWFSVSFSGAIRLKGEQPLGYGWTPAP